MLFRTFFLSDHRLRTRTWESGQVLRICGAFRHCIAARHWRLYARVFGSCLWVVSQNGHQARCINALRRCDEMTHGYPRCFLTSPFDEISGMNIADQGAEETARTLGCNSPGQSKFGGDREFVTMLMDNGLL
jgi:hypothetical protein